VRDGFHRFDGEWVSQAEWAQMPESQRRIARALGPEPLDDASFLLAPLPAPIPRTTASRHPAVELRLIAGRTLFPARAVWRALYGLGLHWGTLDLFHWGEPPRFSVSALGLREDFSPERAAEGEVLPGLCLTFEPAIEPDPVGVFERMALALAYLRERLGGRAERDHQELDAALLARIRAQLSDSG
jgi:hypothetical protein